MSLEMWWLTKLELWADLESYVGPLAEKLMLVLRDGRKLIGVLRSWDQFGWNT